MSVCSTVRHQQADRLSMRRHFSGRRPGRIRRQYWSAVGIDMTDHVQIDHYIDRPSVFRAVITNHGIPEWDGM
jgi:hypothetical protein